MRWTTTTCDPGDFIIAAQSATFGFQEVRTGISTANGATRLPGKVGWQYAMEMLLTRDMIDADRALAIGLAGWVLLRRRVDGRCAAPRRAAVAGRAPGTASGQGDGVGGQRLPWVDSLRMGETMRRAVRATDDAQEGVAAFMEGREPRWTGR